MFFSTRSASAAWSAVTRTWPSSRLVEVVEDRDVLRGALAPELLHRGGLRDAGLSSPIRRMVCAGCRRRCATSRCRCPSFWKRSAVSLPELLRASWTDFLLNLVTESATPSTDLPAISATGRIRESISTESCRRLREVVRPACVQRFRLDDRAVRPPAPAAAAPKAASWPRAAMTGRRSSRRCSWPSSTRRSCGLRRRCRPSRYRRPSELPPRLGFNGLDDRGKAAPHRAEDVGLLLMLTWAPRPRSGHRHRASASRPRPRARRA
jgi:hypothetical protein